MELQPGYSKSINQIAREVHKLAIEKGWWQTDRPFTECAALMMCEIAEAIEEYRDNKPAVYFDDCGNIKEMKSDELIVVASSQKPEGVLIELADCVIRIMDFCASKDWDLEQAINIKHNFNRTRPVRHGNKLA